jgi:predicted glycoside hydrolase/deacetylase ChbG (UPF0249 family)
VKKSFVALLTLSVLSLLFFSFSTEVSQLLYYKHINAPLNVQGKNLAQELGYAADAKLLIINSDDTGAHPTLLHGAIEAMQAGIVKSTSIIVNRGNDRELEEISEVARQNPSWGFGIHLMLTNEYQAANGWSPVLPCEQVPSLCNAKGYAWLSVDDVAANVDPTHAALEFDAQIKKALKHGFKLTHIDSHMGTIYIKSRYPNADPDGLHKAAVAMAKKYSLPLTINTFDKNLASTIEYMDVNQMIRPDTFYGFYELDELNPYLGYQGSIIQRWMTAKVVKLLMGFDLPYLNYLSVEQDSQSRAALMKQTITNFVKPGLNHIFMHAAKPVEGQDIPKVYDREAGLDKVIRLSDLAVWTSLDMKEFLEENDITLINYSYLQQLQIQRNTNLIGIEKE